MILTPFLLASFWLVGKVTWTTSLGDTISTRDKVFPTAKAH